MASKTGGGATRGKPGWLYLITEDDKNYYYKIGCTTTDSVDDRIDQLQTGNPRKLQIVHSCPAINALAAEQSARERIYKHDWVIQTATGGGTEWFEVKTRQVKKMISILDEEGEKNLT